MGKSPGKWIKTVLFGKKNSKTQFSKNVTPGKRPAAKTAVEDPAGDSLVMSNSSQFNNRGADDIEIEKGPSGTLCAANGLVPDQGGDPQSNIVSVSLTDAEMQRQEEAAAKAQAAFRGYLARRAFRALKGIIRLQALIRGHLVRRQAVATLRCMQAIVKLQALARGQKDAKLVNIGADSFFLSEKIATNLFVRKLLVSLPTAMPLSLQYDMAEPNSAWNWLERWSLSHLWESPTRIKKTSNPKPHRKQGSAQTVEPDSGKSKRTIRKVSAATNGDNDDAASAETDKPKRNPRKITQTESVQEHPQTELERVKRNLKKVAASAALASEKSETEPEKPNIVINSAAPDDSEQDIVISSEKTGDSDAVDDKPVSLEALSIATTIDELVEGPHDDHPILENHSSQNGEKTDNNLILNEELSVKEEESGKENQKTRKRRSLPAKQEYRENISQNTPSLPSYMAATESAKAKLRAQAAAAAAATKISEDGAAYNHVRRHSLPSLTNNKLTSMSPRIQKPVQANGKGGSKVNKSMTSSRDDKGLQSGWRR